MLGVCQAIEWHNFVCMYVAENLTGYNFLLNFLNCLEHSVKCRLVIASTHNIVKP
jgi:hypothetical protein